MAQSTTRKKEIIQKFIRPFDLEQAPLLRVGLIKVSEKEHIFMTDMHHIVSDATSNRILVNDFFAYYNELNLPQLKLQYKDYSEWQYIQKYQTEIKKQEEYWLNQFKDEIPILNLPYDFK